MKGSIGVSCQTYGFERRPDWAWRPPASPERIFAWLLWHVRRRERMELRRQRQQVQNLVRFGISKAGAESMVENSDPDERHWWD
jgi:hypothetical protein